jgi:hypothetical protein
MISGHNAADFRYRVARRLRIFDCWLRGGHIFSPTEWGYGYTGTVDLYCGRCGIHFDTVPLEDFVAMDDVLILINEARP